MEHVMTNQQALITDIEREEALARLREACVDGRLTLEEFSDRMDMALAARQRGELSGVIADLNVTMAAPRRERNIKRWLVAIMGSTKHTGRWRIGDSNAAVALMGECDIDLRGAEVDAAEVTINAYALMGEVKIIVPEGVDVDFSGFAFMGEKKAKLSTKPPLPGAPLIRVNGYALMGTVKVEHRD
jgi:hypothetical protein